MEENKIFKLDCMAEMLAYTVSRKRPMVYRLMISIDEEVDPSVLTQAVRDLVGRFPVLYSRLNSGFMRNYLVVAQDLDIVSEENTYPCRPFDFKNKTKPLMRILYKNNEISLEATHFASDGYGAAIYLNSLAARYYELRGRVIEKSEIVLDYSAEPSQKELEDAYLTTEVKPAKGLGNILYAPAFACLRKRRKNYFQVTVVSIQIDELKKHIQEKYSKNTITEYLCAVYASAFLKIYESSRKTRKRVRIGIPCTLRQFWQTETLRNFVGGGYIEFAPKDKPYEFTDVLSVVHREMPKIMTPERQSAFLSQSVHYLDNILLKLVPNFIIKAVFSVIYKFLPLFYPNTTNFSNVGYIDLPPSLSSLIGEYSTFLGEMDVNSLNCTAIGVNNVINMSFSSANESNFVQEFCTRFLESEGLNIKVNRRNV